MQRTESVSHSNVDENTEGTPVNRKSDFSNPKASKPKNKKKKKWLSNPNSHKNAYNKFS